jgi:hypothetical protein
MSPVLKESVRDMAGRQGNDPKEDRVEVRIAGALKKRIEAISKARFGRINVSLYIRMATIERLERDEAEREVKP